MLQGDTVFKLQQTDEPDDGRDALFQPGNGRGSATGDFGYMTRSTSLYTRYLELYPNRKRALLAAAAIGAVALLRRGRPLGR